MLCEVEASNEQFADQRSNPLNNSVVLTTLFEFCDLSDLRNYRLVCKEWYAAAEVRIRNEMIASFPMFPCLQLGLQGSTFFVIDVIPIDEETTALYNYIYTQSSMSDLAYDTNTCFNQIYKNIDQFWELQGPFIRKLELVEFSVNSEDAWEKVLFEQMPNLEELTLEALYYFHIPGKECNWENEEVGRIQSNLKSLTIQCDNNFFPIEWKRIFLKYPKIQKLELRRVSPVVITALHDVWKSLDEIPLKELSLSHLRLIPQVTNLLQLPKLKLSKLEMKFEETMYVEEIDGRILREALRKNGNWLKELVVKFCFRCYFDSKEALWQGNNFPFLETFEFIGKRLSEGEMEGLVKVMPNVEEFKGDIDGPALRVICKNWKKLRVLELHSRSDIGDEALTGIQNGFEDMCHPNITDLRDLRKLKILNGEKICNTSLWNAILEMPNLHSVYAQLSPKVCFKFISNFRSRTNWPTRKPQNQAPAKSEQGNSKQLNFDEVYNQSTPTNCTVFCRCGLSDDLMKIVFSPFGEIQEVRVLEGKGYGFIRFATKKMAASAIVAVNNTEINGQTVKCTWREEAGEPAKTSNQASA